jgi:hypothetical protein
MERYYVEYLNKSKKFARDTKHFDSYEEAEKWAKNNFEKFDPDMIKIEVIEEEKKPENKKKVTQDFSINTSVGYKELCKKLKSFVVKRSSNPKMENIHVKKDYLYAWNLDGVETMLIIKNTYNLKPGIYAVGNGELIYSEPLETEFIEVFSKSFTGKTIFEDIEVSDGKIKEAIKRSKISLGADETRPTMNSSILDLQKGQFNIASTNAHILYKAKFNFDKDIINTVYLGGKETLPIYELMEDYLNISMYGEKDISSIKFSNIEIIVKHPGRYPKYEAVIPGNTKKKIIFNTELLQKADEIIKRDKVVRKLTPTNIKNGTELQFSYKKAYLKLYEKEEKIALGDIEYSEDFKTIGFDSLFLIMPRMVENTAISFAYDYIKKVSQDVWKAEIYFTQNNAAAIVNSPIEETKKRPTKKAVKKVVQEQPKKAGEVGEKYEITFEDIFSFATMKKTGVLSDKEYELALRQKKNKDVVINKFNKSKGIREQYRIKDIKKVVQEQPKKVIQEQRKKVVQEEPKKVVQEQPKIRVIGETKTREKRTATKDLLMSKNEFEVYLGVVYKLAKKVREAEKTKADKFRITRQMNIIKTGYMQDTNENKIKVAKMLAPLVQDIMNNAKVQADKRMIDTYTKIYDIYKSFGAKKRTSKDEKEKENVLATFNKLK